MNLSDMAEHVCETVRKTDSDAVAACKGFIQRRDQMLWDKYLWKDSLYQFSKTIGPTMTDLYPLGWLGESIANIRLLAAQGYFYLPAVVDRVLGMRTSSGPLPVQSMERYFTGSLDVFAETGTPVEFILLDPVVWQSVTSQLVYLVSANASDTAEVVMNYIDAYQGSRTAIVTLTGTTPVYVGSTSEIFSLTKPPTSGVVSLLDASQNTVGAVFAASTDAYRYQRVQLLPAPTSDLAVRCLVKKRYVPISGDYEAPRLRQAENVLIALATGDMFVRSGQVGAANQFYAEGMALLQQLGNIEFHQQANRQRLVPLCEPDPLRDRGYTGAFSGKGYW